MHGTRVATCLRAAAQTTAAGSSACAQRDRVGVRCRNQTCLVYAFQRCLNVLPVHSAGHEDLDAQVLPACSLHVRRCRSKCIALCALQASVRCSNRYAHAGGDHEFYELLESQDCGAWVNCIAWTPNGSTLVVATHDSRVRFWSPATDDTGASSRGKSERLHYAGVATAWCAVRACFVHLLSTTRKQYLSGVRGRAALQDETALQINRTGIKFGCQGYRRFASQLSMTTPLRRPGGTRRSTCSGGPQGLKTFRIGRSRNPSEPLCEARLATQYSSALARFTVTKSAFVVTIRAWRKGPICLAFVRRHAAQVVDTLEQQGGGRTFLPNASRMQSGGSCRRHRPQGRPRARDRCG